MSSSQPARGNNQKTKQKLPGNATPSSQPATIGRTTPPTVENNNSISEINESGAQVRPDSHRIDGKDRSRDPNNDNNLTQSQLAPRQCLGTSITYIHQLKVLPSLRVVDLVPTNLKGNQ